VTYDDIAAHYFSGAGGLHPAPEVPDSAARRLRDALEPIATQGWWSRAVADNMSALNLNFFGAYVWGRAASLGTPSASSVVSAFGVFEPTFISNIYLATRDQVSRDDILSARADGASTAMELICSPDEAISLNKHLRKAMESVDGCARPLFSGLRELPMPTTAQGQLWRLAEMFREHRGDGHLASCITHGLSAIDMNIVTELWLGYDLGEYSGTRGFSQEALNTALQSLNERGITDGPRLTQFGYELRTLIETDTDRTQDEIVAALGSSLEDVISLTNVISQRIIDYPGFPSDPRKRAAG
jgi:hypothetical protein